ncbi:MAG: carbon starvation protein A [Clostridia bacterium]|nr:carbon starvation protein A [Clostridia bacterium]
MTTFLIGLVLLIGGGALYGRFCEKVFGADGQRKTPAYTKQDAIDYVPIKTWKNTLINLLNIAGTGPIFGPIQGILFGPVAFITIPLGNIIGGAMHDYFCGMICLRDGGAQMSETVRRYSNRWIYTAYQIFCSLLLLIVGAVFIYTPGDIIATQILGLDGKPTSLSTWIIYAAIFAYYLAATVFPIDKIIGKIYPVFGALLLFSAVGIFAGIFLKGYPLTELWGSWEAPLAFVMRDGAQVPFSYRDYFSAEHFIPAFFITVACGILSGFHSTQTAILSRTVENERQGRKIFYNSMVLEGLIAMIWAAAAMGIYNMGMQAADANLYSSAVGMICRDMLGNVGGVAALLGIIVLPITSGDTALRGLRLAIAEAFHIDQKSIRKRLALTGVLFVIVAAILVFAKLSPEGFKILWRYFAWFNQALSLFAFMVITSWMFEHGKVRFVWMPLIPGAFYAFVTITYIVNAKIGFGLPWGASYIIGAVFAAAYMVLLLWYGKRRAQRLLSPTV